MSRDVRWAFRFLPILAFVPVLTLAAPAGKSGVEVERSARDGRVRALRGDLTFPSPEGPRAIAERFLSGPAQSLGMRAGLQDLKLSRSVESLAGRHFQFDQTYRGLPVFDAGVEGAVATDR